MKKTADISNSIEEELDDDLLPEYRLDYSKAKPNRFALGKNARVIVLDPDIAEFFKTSEAVNKALRALISAIPETTRQ